MTVPNLEYVRLQVASRLPVRVRWLIDGTPDDFDFSRARAPLQPLRESEIHGDIENEWRSLYLFGDEDYAEGGGAQPVIGVHCLDGRIFGLDVERNDSQLYLLNSNIDCFVRTFRLFDEGIRLKTIDLSSLASAANDIDPAIYPKSDWCLLANDLVTY